MFLLAVLCVLAASRPGIAAPSSATTAPASAARTNAAVLPATRDQDGPRKRFEELNKRVAAAQGNVDLVFLGDSITQGWENSGKQVWEKFYAPRKALNLGIGGDRTQHVLYRLENGNIKGIKPKLIVLMIGTNNSNRDEHTPGEILEGVTAIVAKLRRELPDAKILLLGIFPRGATFNDQRGKILQVNQALAKLDNGNTIQFLDFGSRLIEPDGSISKQVMPDFLHLSEKGYEIWAQAIEPFVSKGLGDNQVR